MAKPEVIVRRWLDAIEARDLDAVVGSFSANARWQNVPSPPAVGHDAIRAMLGPILERSERVVWDLVTESYSDERAWLERVDRFLINGTEYAVRCNGVLEFDTEAGLITELRDYVDLAEWRERLASADLNHPGSSSI
jgi:limonene-1,2-epoxide hydrolase